MTDPTEITLLLRRLLESFTDHHQDIELDFRAMRGRVDWLLKGNIDDQGKLVGKQAAHIKALKFILAAIGEKAGEQYFIRLLEAETGERGAPSPRRIAPPDYNPEPTLELLHDLLRELLEQSPLVEAFDDHNQDLLGWKFLITCHSIQDHERLVGEEGAVPNAPSLLDALGTLFCAAGNRDGVSFKLDVP